MTVSADTLVLDEPLSFWGGYDPHTGIILDRHHPQAGLCVSGKILVLPATRGSGGTPACFAESLRRGVGPAAVIVRGGDVNLTTGALVAKALYGIDCPVLDVSGEQYDELRQAKSLTISQDGAVK